jgi:hypothetical protein
MTEELRGIPIDFDEVAWAPHARITTWGDPESPEKSIIIEYGWLAGFTNDEIANVADDAPTETRSFHVHPDAIPQLIAQLALAYGEIKS